MFGIFREMVSRDKMRYRKNGFDLDLTFISDRIIAMGIPGQNIEKAWRNDIDQVARLFRETHGGHFLILNLSDEQYDYSKVEIYSKNSSKSNQIKS
eukprot:TRINITY_DN13100_c0_g1_i1.p2 TRINITY_DN13100_c0_g1~~TRINITY_DN13100_c0_g1_i1.p2  ORF type:complete len:106 (-),score=11.54 TRINITY_DN13100_c0_g1_i1:580-867(-)